jgi:hypothetical protein
VKHVAYETNETAIHHPKGFPNQMHPNLEGTKISQAKNPLRSFMQDQSAAAYTCTNRTCTNLQEPLRT